MADNIADTLGPQKVPVPDRSDNTQSDTVDFTATEYVQHVKYMEMISMRASEPVRRMWDKAWGLYNNSYDFSLKAQWQSKNYIPRINMTVRAATFMIKRALMGPAQPFTTEGVGDFGKLVAYYMNKITLHHLEEGKFVTNTTDSLHAGLLSSLMVLKVYPVYVNDESIYWTDNTAKPTMNVMSPIKTVQYKRLKIRIDPCDPYNVHLDPTGQNKFIIHDITMDLYDLKEIAKDKTSGYDIDEINKIQEDFTRACADTSPTSQPEYRSGQSPESTDQRRARTVLIQEYWGDVWSTDGRLVARNVVFAIANKKYLIRPPVINEYPDKKNPPPFIISPVIRKPFSVWHQNFSEVVAGLQIMMTELMNLMLDANLFASAKAFEVDIDQVYDPLEFIQGIVPGKTYKKRGGGFNTVPMIKEISIGTVAQQSLQIFQALDREFQSGIGLNEFAMPAARSSGSRTTATEVLEKSQSATTFMEEIARTVEENVMEPMLEKIYHYITEYTINFEDQYMLELFGADEASKLTIFMRNPAFRRAMHNAPFKFKARGISASVGKLRDLEKISQLSRILQPYPELLKQVDPQKILRKIIESMGWYPQDILMDMDKPMVAPPASMPSVQMPTMPIGQTGDVVDLLGRANNGMQQVPNAMNPIGG